MSKLHFKATSSKPKNGDLGRCDVYKLSEVDFELSLHTVAGGKETIQPADVDRLMIVLNGFANTIGDKPQVIRDGAIIEIKAGETFEYQGQLKYFLVS